jgi:anti-sigma factor RsiW
MRPTRLVGGRVCKIKGRKVELLFYELGEQRLSLYISDQPTGVEACHSDGEHSVCGRRSGHLSLMLVGRAPGHELRTLLDEVSL